MSDNTHIFSRTEMLMGAEAMERLRRTRVIIFGLGGVGSWCAEALVRSGVGHLTLVDPDYVDVTNINRQLPALSSTLGRPKVEVLRERFLDINPEAEIVARQERFTADTAASFEIEKFDYVIDAIDSVADKLELILVGTRRVMSAGDSPAQADSVCRVPTLFSSMGAARKMAPLQVRVTEFWKVDGCPLAATLRKRMRKQKRFPERKFQCVWSPERNDDAQPKGTLMPVTATFGLTLASLVIKDIIKGYEPR